MANLAAAQEQASRTWTCASRAPGPGREVVGRALNAALGMKTRASDVTPVPHNGCRRRSATVVVRIRRQIDPSGEAPQSDSAQELYARSWIIKIRWHASPRPQGQTLARREGTDLFLKAPAARSPDKSASSTPSPASMA